MMIETFVNQIMVTVAFSVFIIGTYFLLKPEGKK